MINEKIYNSESARLGRKSGIILLFIAVLAFLFGEVLLGSGWIVISFVAFSFALGQLFAKKTKGKQFIFEGRPVTEFDGYQDPEIFQLVNLIYQRSNLENPPRLYLIHESTANAFATGDEASPEVYLTSGLLDQLTPRELAGVLAHELAHLDSRDMLMLKLAQLVFHLTSFLTLYIQILLIVSIPLIVTGVIEISLLLLVLLFTLPYSMRLLTLALMRSREFAADLKAVYWTQDPKGLASALLKINYQHLPKVRSSLIFPNPWSSSDQKTSLYDSHPSAKERVEKLLSLENF